MTRDDMSVGTAGIPVSVIVMTKNEQDNIEACLRSVSRFDEVFVVDSGSVDRTAELARELGATVVDYAWDGKYPKKKQWCLEHLDFRHDLVLYLDADERVPKPLEQAIAGAAAAPGKVKGWFVTMELVWEGRTLRHGDRMRKLVLFDRRCGRYKPVDDLAADKMWEVEGHYQPVVDGPLAWFDTPLVHDDHDTLYEWFAQHNRYSEWEAVVRTRGVLTADSESQIGLRGRAKAVFYRMPFRPLAWFLYTYIGRSGWRDGRPGFNYCFAKSVYQWQINIKSEELRRRQADAAGDGA